ncbi:MAG: M15 family metallopeptidase [Spirulinaceae cyanobacterium]
MGKAGSQKKIVKRSLATGDDVPEALRENNRSQTQFSRRKILLISGGLILGIISLLAGALFSNPVTPPKAQQASPSPEREVIPSPEKEDLLGHLPYEEIDKEKLAPVTANGSIKMHKNAAVKFKEMVNAASAEGINLVALSGFRSVEDQKQLFFQVKEQRGEIASQRAEVSAPPGYSEHHTGYAIDIGDGKLPAANLKTSFEETPAFKWLEKNAPRYSFELSFPEDNPQGIAYEPWHWRFVGDIESLETFYKNKEEKIKTGKEKLEKLKEQEQPKNDQKQ